MAEEKKVKTIKTAEQIYKELSAPFELEMPDGKIVPGHKWKINTSKYGTADCVPYIDARQVSGRLNDVVGLGGWSDTKLKIDRGVVCELSVLIGKEWITRADIGTVSVNSNANQDTKDKSEFSDSLKRAGVHFGIAAYLYKIGTVKLPKNGSKAMTRDKQKTLNNPEELTAYLNETSVEMMMLAQLWRSTPKEIKEKEGFKESIQQLYGYYG
ncbi:hypothetical protein KA005_08940 [bacterium]|nr:hypothetical protein [bacterium]